MKLLFICNLIAAFFGFSFQECHNDFTRIEQLFLHKKTNPNPRSIELKSETIVKGIPLEHNDLLYLQTFIANLGFKRWICCRLERNNILDGTRLYDALS